MEPQPPPPGQHPQGAELDLAKQNELTCSQLNAITAEIAAASPLVSAPAPLATLLPEYQDNPRSGFAAGIGCLASRYAAFRRVRGDGNCFYRCFLFGFLEQLVRRRERGAAAPAEAAAVAAAAAAEAERVRVLAVVRQSKDDLVSIGYEEVAIDTFWEVLVEFLEDLPNTSLSELETQFNEANGPAEYMVWYCRALCAGYMKRNGDRFLPFILSLDDGSGTAVADIGQFCRQEVEPMGRECEQVQIIALCEALSVGVSIEYLDGAPLASGGTLPCVQLPESLTPQINLLYRPGHYDLLYLA